MMSKLHVHVTIVTFLKGIQRPTEKSLPVPVIHAIPRAPSSSIDNSPRLCKTRGYGLYRKLRNIWFLTYYLLWDYREWQQEGSFLIVKMLIYKCAVTGKLTSYVLLVYLEKGHVESFILCIVINTVGVVSIQAK